MSVEISPATTTSPVVISVSQATRPWGSSARTASRTVSEIWSATLSGCPSVTDSEVKRNSRAAMGPQATQNARLLDAQEERDLQLVGAAHGVLDRGAQRLQVPLHLVRNPRTAEPVDHRDRAVDVDIEHDLRRGRQARAPARFLVLLAVGQRLAAVLREHDPSRKVGDDQPALDVGVAHCDRPRSDHAGMHAGDRRPPRSRAEFLREPVQDAVQGSRAVQATAGCSNERHLGHILRTGSADVERVLALQDPADLLKRIAEAFGAELLQDRVVAQPAEHPLRAVEREIEERILGHDLLQAAGRGARVDVLERLARRPVHGRVPRDPVGLRAQRHQQPVERAELLEVGPGILAHEVLRRSHHARAFYVRAEDAVTRLAHCRREILVVRKRALRGVTCLLEGVDRCLLVGHQRPAVELLVDELARGIACVALLHCALERALVLRLHQGDGLARMCEIERHHVDLRPEGGLEVTVPVESFLEQLLVDRVDRLLLVRELAREVVHGLPLGRVQVGVERHEERDRSRDDVAGARAGIRRAAAACEQEREHGEENAEPAYYRVVSRTSTLLIDPERAPKATSVPNFSSFGMADGLDWPFPVSEASACRIGASRWMSAYANHVTLAGTSAAAYASLTG